MTAWTPVPVGEAPLPYRLDGLARALRALLLLAALLSAALAFLAVRMRSALDDVDRTAVVVGQEANDAVDAFFGGCSVFFLAVAGIGVLFVTWMWRAARNNQSFGRPGALHPAWAIGGWFIPLGSLVLPAIQIQQIWRGADGTVPRDDPGWRRARSSPQVWAWWTAYVVAQALTFVGFSLFGDADDGTVAALVDRLDDVRLGVTLFVAGQVIMILAAALGAAIVVGLSRRQEEAANLLAAGVPTPAPAFSPPAWHPDPTGRFDHRYWDGKAWTDHVARAGQSDIDPV
jgi:Domain of unknown function (DUF4328)/Protein of unknown function (DUF2510)